MKLADKIALITGGNSGIGLATACLFTQMGAQEFRQEARREEGAYPEAVCVRSRKAGQLPTKRTSLLSSGRSQSGSKMV
jgi:NAD(P)-dependent dehydrogenase (short-subunit alcohol dehydrogenase family)